MLLLKDLTTSLKYLSRNESLRFFSSPGDCQYSGVTIQTCDATGRRERGGEGGLSRSTLLGPERILPHTRKGRDNEFPDNNYTRVISPHAAECSMRSPNGNVARRGRRGPACSERPRGEAWRSKARTNSGIHRSKRARAARRAAGRPSSLVLPASRTRKPCVRACVRATKRNAPILRLLLASSCDGSPMAIPERPPRIF